MRASTIAALAGVDALQIRRDPLLRWVMAIPLVIALAARGVLPVLLRRLESRLDTPLLTWYEPIMGAALLLLVPMLVGMVAGFLLLDQRDDRTLSALQVTPLPLRSYVAFRLAAPMMLSVAMTLVALPVAGFGPAPAALLLAALAVAPIAPLYALGLAGFAANKVEGFALVKVAGAITALPVFALFVSGRGELLLALVPTYWQTRLYWSLTGADTGPAWLFALVGVTYAGAVLSALWRRFRRRIVEA